MPREAALRFISATKAFILPEMRTAAAPAASLPLASSMPTASAYRVTVSPCRRPMLEPSTRMAVSSTVNSCCRLGCSRVSRAVMIFVVLAMGSCRWISCANSTSPLSASITMAAAAPTP